MTAIEDMVLPMGSFPSRMLNPWSSTPNCYNSNPLPSTSNSESKQEAVPAPDEPIHIQDTTNDIPTLSFSPMTTIEIEPVVVATSPAVINELSGFHIFENEIRGLIDPKGIHAQSKLTKELVADMINKHAEDVNDMKRDWATEREAFEGKIEDQETKYHELKPLYVSLLRQFELEKETSLQLGSKNKCLEDQIEEKIQDRKDALTKADKAEQVAKAGVQKRIEEVKTALEQTKKVAEDKLRQKLDSVILLKSRIESELAETRSEVNVLKQQQKTMAEKNTAALNEYKECLKKRNLAVTASEKSTELAERNLEALRNDTLKKDSEENATLQKQLRASKDLAKSLETWKTKAENHEQIYQRLREEVKNTADDIRENKDHEINDLKLDIRGLRRDMATDEVTISRQNSEIAKLKSGKELLKLKSELEQAKKQLKDAELETQKLRRNLTTGETKSKQDAENALLEMKSQHQEDKRIAVDHAIQQAETAAAGKAAEKQQEYEQRITSAVQDAMNNAAEKAAKKKQEYEMAMRAEVDGATRKAVAEMKSKAAAENAAAEVEKQAARETEMDIAPDPELEAELMKEVEDALRKQQQQDEIDKAVKDAVERALENANQQHQQEKANAVQIAVQMTIEAAEQEHQKKVAKAVQDAVQKPKQDAMVNSEEEKNDLIPAKKAAEAAQQAQEAPEQVIQAKSSNVADHQTSSNPIDLTLAATEADEASKLLDEVAKNGVAVDTIEYTVLHRLTNMRGALRNIKATLQLPNAPTEPSHYQEMLHISRLEESVLEHLYNETNHKLLVRQGRLANERLRTVSEILKTSGVQKDAILQALIGPKRQVAPARGLKRPTQSKKPTVDNSQPYADYPPTPSAKPKADNRQSFADLMKSLKYC